MNVETIRTLKDTTSKPSYFRKKIEDAKQLGNNWEGKDIRYYATYLQLEQNKKKKQDALEIKRAQQKYQEIQKQYLALKME